MEQEAGWSRGNGRIKGRMKKELPRFSYFNTQEN
jgi:hypothetical protein